MQRVEFLLTLLAQWYFHWYARRKRESYWNSTLQRKVMCYDKLVLYEKVDFIKKKKIKTEMKFKFHYNPVAADRIISQTL